MNTDQFGALGKSKESQMLKFVAVLENVAAQENFSDADRLLLMKNILLSEIKNLSRPDTKAYSLALNLVQQLDKDIRTVEDVIIFCVTMKYVVAHLFRRTTKNFARQRQKISLIHSAKKKLHC